MKKIFNYKSILFIIISILTTLQISSATATSTLFPVISSIIDSSHIGKNLAFSISNDGNHIMMSDKVSKRFDISADGGETWVNGIRKNKKITLNNSTNTCIGGVILRDLGCISNYLTKSAISADGSKIVSLIGFYIYISNDGGQTWDEITSLGMNNWTGLVMSQDGLNITVSSVSVWDPSGSSTRGFIYTSRNGGNTWMKNIFAGGRQWSSVSMSENGNKMVAVTTNNSTSSIYRSIDGGMNWTIVNIPIRANSNSMEVRDGARQWNKVFSSLDGSKVIATTIASSLFTSTDYGATWTEISSSTTRGFSGIRMSADGSTLIARANHYPQISTDMGQSWATLPWRINSNVLEWNFFDNGNKLVALHKDSKLYISNR